MGNNIIPTFVMYLGTDAKVKTTSKGDQYTILGGFAESGYGDRAESFWVSLFVYGRQAEYAGTLRKNDLIQVTGEIQAPTVYEDKAQMSVQVMALKTLKRANGSSEPAPKGKAKPAPVEEDDLPF